MNRVIFSTTTIESSTKRPNAITKPTIDSWLMLKPVAFNITTANASDSGIEIITTSDARVPSGSNVISTSAIAIAKSSPSRARRVSTFCDWSKPRASVTPRGRVFCKRSSSAQTSVFTLDTLRPAWTATVTNIARCPL